MNRNDRVKELQAIRRRIRETVTLRRLIAREAKSEPQPATQAAE